MLRIFGFYAAAGLKHKISLQDKIKQIFEIKSGLTRFYDFKLGDIFVDYEAVNSPEAKRFFCAEPDKKLSCFVIGNIFASDDPDTPISNTSNLADLILKLYRKKELYRVSKFRGTFAVVIIDNSKLVILNDALGSVPVYLYKTGFGLFFSTQAEPIIWLNIDNNIDYNAIAYFMVYGFVPFNRTFIEGLRNLSPGSFLTYDKGKAGLKKYAVFQKDNISGYSRKGLVELGENLFSESVKIRISSCDRIYTELSGGWDTRFVLAHLLRLKGICKRDIFAFTVDRNKEDYEITRRLTPRLGIKHIILRHSKELEIMKQKFYERVFSFKCVCTIPDDPLGLKAYEFGRDNEAKRDFFISPRFTGIFGTELFGLIPEWFILRANLDFATAGRHIFSKNIHSLMDFNSQEERRLNSLKHRAMSDYIYLFITQIGRSYLNAHYIRNWQRPTRFFSYMLLTPFSDSKFLSFLSSLRYRDYLHYKLYSQIYELYYPDFLKVPWTFIPGRKEFPLDGKSRNTRRVNVVWEEKRRLIKLAKSDNGFREFIGSLRIINKESSVIVSRIKELFFLYNWVKANREVLNGREEGLVDLKGL